MKVNFDTKILSKFKEFRENNLFIDCILDSNDQQIKCHRIILGNFSNYFKNIFICNSTQNMFYSVPFNPKNLLSDVIDFFYTNTIFVSNQNFPFFAAIAKFYEIDSLMEILETQLDNVIQTSDILNMLSIFIEYKVANMRDKLIPIIAKDFNDLDHIQLYRSLDTYSFTQILQVQKMNEWEKISEVEEFVSIKGLKNVDCELLSYLLQWDENSYEYFLFYQMDWVPCRIQRNYLSTILTNRRTSSKAFDQTNSELPEKYVNRWFVTQWIKEISDSDGSTQLPPVELIDFILTLGGIAEEIDTIKFDFIGTDSSPSIGSLFNAKEVFLPTKSYFMTIPRTGYPYLSISFDNNLIFIPNQIVLIGTKEKNNKPLPLGLEIEFSHVKYSDLYFKKAKCELTLRGRVPPLNQMDIRMTKENEYGGNAFRVSNIKLFGNIKATY